MTRNAVLRLMASLGVVLAITEPGSAQTQNPSDAKGPFDVSVWTKDDPDNGGQECGTYTTFQRAYEVAQRKVTEPGIRKVAISWWDGDKRMSRVLTPPPRPRKTVYVPNPTEPPTLPVLPPINLKPYNPPNDPDQVKAQVNGKYSKLLRRVKVPDDRGTYGTFNDYGYYGETSWAGYTGLPQGYWVYVYPYWYIWGEQKR